MATFFESGTWVWIPDEDEVVLPAKAKTSFRLGERATVILENGSVSARQPFGLLYVINPTRWRNLIFNSKFRKG